MNKKSGIAIVSVLFISFMLCTMSLIAQEMESEMNGSLSLKQQKVLAIAAFTANGDMENLIRVLNEGLDSGLTVNEIGEVLLQMYAYAGFPRSLNGLGALSSVLEERQAEGTRDPSGTEPDSLPEDTDKYAMGVSNLGVLMGFPLDQQKSETNGYTEAMDAFLKEHLFADIFGRNNLSFDMRELATVGALSSLEGTNSQLLFHMGAAMNCGISEDQMHHAVDVIGKELGSERGNNAEGVLVQVLERRRGMAGN
jgi:4-carboxymuconolactone decarboxylase